MFLLVATLTLLSVKEGTAQARETSRRRHWRAPKSCLFTRNPVAATSLSIRQGKEVFQTRCYGCHGAAGRGDGPDASQLRIHPARLSGDRVQEQTDGALFWKITFGKSPMPGYGFRLSPNDRWHVINYLRTLAEHKDSREGEPASQQSVD